MATSSRTPEEIRASIEANRHDLAHSLGRLRGELTVAADWRGQLGRDTGGHGQRTGGADRRGRSVVDGARGDRQRSRVADVHRTGRVEELQARNGGDVWPTCEENGSSAYQTPGAMVVTRRVAERRTKLQRASMELGERFGKSVLTRADLLDDEPKS